MLVAGSKFNMTELNCVAFVCMWCSWQCTVSLNIFRVNSSIVNYSFIQSFLVPQHNQLLIFERMCFLDVFLYSGAKPKSRQEGSTHTPVPDKGWEMYPGYVKQHAYISLSGLHWSTSNDPFLSQADHQGKTLTFWCGNRWCRTSDQNS